jgi:hypothetical protein
LQLLVKRQLMPRPLWWGFFYLAGYDVYCLKGTHQLLICRGGQIALKQVI